MASFPKEHESLYFDALIRTQKKESVLAFIMATHFAKKNNDGTVVREDLYKRLEYAYGLFRDNVRGYDNGVGSYSGTDGQFYSQYTLGLEMGIWKNSRFDLNDLAIKVAKNEITITDYFDIILLNYIQPVAGKIVHPLFQVLKYLKSKNSKAIKKTDFFEALELPETGNNEAINALYNILICTSYFIDNNNELIVSDKYTINDLLAKCNKTYLCSDGYQKAKEELENNDDKYIEYLISKNYHEASEEEINREIESEEKIEDRKNEFKKWLENKGKYTPNTIRNYSYYINYIRKHEYTEYDLYSINDISIIEDLIIKFNSDEKYILWNKNNRYTPSNALNEYKKFLIEKYQKRKYFIASIKNYSTVHKLYFDANGYMYWKQGQTGKYQVGDIIYLYFSEDNNQDIKYIRKKAIITEINVPSTQVNEEKLYINDVNENYNYIKVELIGETENENLSYRNLNDKYGFIAPQIGTTLIENNELIDYIENAFKNDENYEKNQYSVIDDLGRETGGENIIYYGGPGCGKSYKVNSRYCVDKNCFVRTTFFPDYTNSDFVGQLIPKIDKEHPNRIKYEVQPGPFTLALEKALLNKKKHIYLIIEEINRGNASAIFGDIFQLLDRVSEDKDHKLIGMSEYVINNYIIEEYLKDIIKNKEIYIPSNLSIIATMNTSDQNVYTLDTAFKRRWKMEYVSNKFDEELDKEIFNKLIPVPGKTEYTWREFVDTINNAIVDKNKFGMNSEDKQIGKYFVGTHDLYDNVEEYNNKEEAIKTFAEKILMYLWEDVAKLNRNEWFDDEYKTLEALINGYKEKGLDVFKIDFKSSNEVEENE